MSVESPSFLTRQTAAEEAAVSVQTIDEWRKLPGFPQAQPRPGGAVRIPRKRFLEWLAGGPTD